MPRRFPCVVLDDDDGLSKLECFLRGYRRVTRAQACQQPMESQPVVWAYKDNVWAPMDAAQVQKLIDSSSPDKSLCGAIFGDMPGYEHFKEALDDVNIPDAIGLYEKDGHFAIVVRLPHKPSLDLLDTQQVGFFSGMAALGVGDYILRRRNRRTQLMIKYEKAKTPEEKEKILDEIIRWDVYRLLKAGVTLETLQHVINVLKLDSNFFFQMLIV